MLLHFSEHILPFNVVMSQFYSELMARVRVSGKAIGAADGYIAAQQQPTA